MVRLTIELLIRCSSSFMKKRRDESKKAYLRRITHLHLEAHDIDEIDNELSFCHNLTVLYMYDNSLVCLPNLHRNQNLTHLYLQNNNIDRIQGLAALHSLTKLYIGSNNIVVVEGLESLRELQELHIENQQLPDGEKMLFDKRSIQAIAGSLLLLNISGNGVTSLSDLGSLSMLRQLTATSNKLRDLQELTKLLSTAWRRLQQLSIANNPLCQRMKYRDRIIVAAPALDMLDEVEVTETMKQFLRSWQANKEAVRQQHETSRTAPVANRLSAYGARQAMSPDENGDMGFLHKNMSDTYSAIPPSYFMPALNQQKFQHFLDRSQSQHLSQTAADVAEQRTQLSGLLGYNSHNMQVGIPRRVSSSDGVRTRLQHLSLHNINLDSINAPLAS